MGWDVKPLINCIPVSLLQPMSSRIKLLTGSAGSKARVAQPAGVPASRSCTLYTICCAGTTAVEAHTPSTCSNTRTTQPTMRSSRSKVSELRS